MVYLLSGIREEMIVERCRTTCDSRHTGKYPPFVFLEIVGSTHRSELLTGIFSSKSHDVMIFFYLEVRDDFLEEVHRSEVSEEVEVICS